MFFSCVHHQNKEHYVPRYLLVEPSSIEGTKCGEGGEVSDLSDDNKGIPAPARSDRDLP